VVYTENRLKIDHHSFHEKGNPYHLVIPKINNQEHQLQFVYWEGTVKVLGDNTKGNGYVELVGY
jgi:hypothetical protein